MRLFVAAAAAFLLGNAPHQPLTIGDVDQLADISEPVFLGDGSAVVYVLTTRNLTIDAKVSDLWLAPWGHGEPRPLTRTATISEWQPTPSPDGKRVFFLSDAAEDETVQLWSIALRGGKARQESRVPGGISDYALSPDGTRAALIAEVGGTQPPAEGLRSQPPLVIDRLGFKEDGRGLIDGRVAQLMLLDLVSGKAAQLTHGTTDTYTPSWSPDGTRIAYVGYRDEAADRARNSDIFVIEPRAGAQPRAVSTSPHADNDPSGTPMRPAWSPDGQHLAWVTMGEARWIYYAPHQLSVADLGDGTVREVGRIDRFIYYPRWSEDGRGILALVEQDRDTWLARFDAETGSVSYKTDGAAFVSAFALGPDGKLAALEADNNHPARLFALDGNSRLLADPNPWLEDKALADTRDISFPSSDGTEIHGLLVTPRAGTVPEGTRPPLLVRVHGGPVYQYSHEFMEDWQVFAARGYAVLAVNPRGSSGRGFDFSRAIYADWGNKDVADVRAGIDWVLAQGLADPHRIGVGGWSYGGFLTNYLIASEPRIGAAVSGAGASNMLGLWGVDQYLREYEQELGAPWDKPETYARLSYPFLQASRITAPTLFLCAGDDLNVPCAGSEQMYAALRSRGVPTRLVVYPGENHGLTAPSHLRDRIERSLDWYDRHLTGASSPASP